MEIKIGEQTVARRMVMRSETWDQLVRLAEALRETRGVEVTPEDVALIALESGLAEVRKGLSVARPRAKAACAPSGPTRRLSRVRARISDAERAELDGWLSDKASVRARQRTIALWLGRRKRRVHLETLRELAVSYDAYNVANFAQNMKKDGVFFQELRDESGARIGWRLSRVGHQEAKAIEALSFVSG